ncbi:MAG: glycosyltransferase, partial [Gammaproteobacteria bacterium]|nr:glycosyltransferase [Gammaproteobacteria bacterium]
MPHELGSANGRAREEAARGLEQGRPEGAITALHGDLLFGWAFDPARPDLRLVVEVLLDGQYAALARADQWQPPEQRCGDGFHGFSVQLKLSWLQQARQITACVANAGPALAGEVSLTDGLRVMGWVWDPLDPMRHVTVRAYEHERCLAETIADRLHPALIEQPTADHGFVLDLPWDLADGVPHHVKLATDQGQLLPGTPITVCHQPEGLAALVRRYCVPGSGDDHAARNLMLTLCEHQDRRAPRALGFSQYDDWKALHERPLHLGERDSRLRVGILLYGDGDEADVQRSRESALQQRCRPHAIRQASGADLLTAIDQLISADCQAVMPLRVGDRLAAHALDLLGPCLEMPVGGSQCPVCVYADCDQDDGEEGARNPWLKPAWDPDLFFGLDLISSGGLFTADVLRAAQQRLTVDPAQGLPLRAHSLLAQWHLLLAAVVAASAEGKHEIVHLPRLLYQRSVSAPASPAELTDEAEIRARQLALQWLAEQLSPGARVESCPRYPGLQRVVWPLPADLPSVSCVIPTRDRIDLLRPCIEGLLCQTDYAPLEIIVVDNESRCPDTLAYLSQLPARGVRVLTYPYPFNFSAINNLAVSEAGGELICLLNNDILIREPQWLREMVRELLRPGVGAVGAKLLWPNAMVQHAGVVVGIHGLAAHVGNGWHIHDPGYLGFNQVTRRYSALTAACLLLRRGLYEEIGGLDSMRFPINFNDVDLCLRIRERGLALVWTPFARLEHVESASRGTDADPAAAARSRREEHHLRQCW